VEQAARDLSAIATATLAAGLRRRTRAVSSETDMILAERSPHRISKQLYRPR